VLADTLRHECRRWRPLSVPSPLLAEPRAVTSDRQRVLYAQQACENQLRAIMETYHPAPMHLSEHLRFDARDTREEANMRVPHWRGLAWAMAAALVGLYVLGVPASTLLISLIVLACPLMMLIMHRADRVHARVTASDGSAGRPTPERR
jgi:Flp pilus assembly protein TadB